MGIADKIAVIGHNGWAASKIIATMAAHPFQQPLRILAREGSSVAKLPPKVEVFRYSWHDQASLRNALQGVDVVISFVGPEGLKDQAKLIKPMNEVGVKLFVPSDLALPYTVEERTHVPVPRDKYELELQLKGGAMPFVVICIGNFTSFAFGSPYMGIDVPKNRLTHIGSSRNNPIYLCSLEYVAAGFVAIFSHTNPSELGGRIIGLNEIRPTTLEIEQAMAEYAGRPPQIAEETVQEMTRQAEEEGRLDALVRKKMGDGTHGVGDDIWEFDYPKKTLRELIRESVKDDDPYVPQTEDSLHFLDKYF